MGNKQLYISDTLHGTIVLSEIEKKVISTKLFNRLHHIHQNSTAYLTFPSNRTKRFEHSLGTMKLCGDIFYNAISNTERSVIEILFNDIQRLLQQEKQRLLDESDKYQEYFERRDYNENIFEKKREVTLIQDIFYNKFIPSNLPRENYFDYLVAFQCVRLCGLLHDIGHPPYSHIVEQVINKKYKEIEAKEDKTHREEVYYEILNSYSKSETGKFQLHEDMGNSMVDSLASSMLQKLTELSLEEHYFNLLVWRVVPLILREQGEVASLLHSIISGSIDGDRLDYVSRDIKNSGIKNGELEYERLVRSCNFLKIKKEDHSENNRLGLAYHSKGIAVIEDFFQKRWFLYKNILKHHRVVKTDLLMSMAIEKLISTYLNSDYKEESTLDVIMPEDISGLWKGIRRQPGNNRYFDSLIQWDDNWLISVLKKHYFRDYYLKNVEEPVLEELLSNHKNFHSLIKHNNDFLIFAKSFLDNLKIESDFQIFLKNGVQVTHENTRYYRHINQIFSEYLDLSMDLKKEIKLFIEEHYAFAVKECLVAENQIKSGINKEEPWLYFENSAPCELSTRSNIRKILELEEDNYPLFYIYVKYHKDQNQIDKEVVLKELGKYISGMFNEKIKEYIKETKEEK